MNKEGFQCLSVEKDLSDMTRLCLHWGYFDFFVNIVYKRNGKYKRNLRGKTIFFVVYHFFRCLLISSETIYEGIAHSINSNQFYFLLRTGVSWFGGFCIFVNISTSMAVFVEFLLPALKFDFAVAFIFSCVDIPAYSM